MALRLDYVARETGQNLVRNWLLSMATVAVVTVSLTFLGLTMLVGVYGIDNAFVKWNNDVSFIVYMNTSATSDQIDSVAKDLDKSPQVDAVDYFDQDESYALFKKIFEQDDPELVDTIRKEDLPTSFRVRPANPDAAVVKELANTFRPKPGVYKVEFPDEQVRQVQSAAGRIRSFLIGGVVVLLAASGALIFIAIQTAVFSRRREIEVMRLVGATNWYIRTPFLIEGVVQGFVGAGAASAFVSLVGKLWSDSGSEFKRSLLAKIAWTDWQQTKVVLIMLGLGTVVGAIASALSTTWYLRA